MPWLAKCKKNYVFMVDSIFFSKGTIYQVRKSQTMPDSVEVRLPTKLIWFNVSKETCKNIFCKPYKDNNNKLPHTVTSV